MVPVSYFQEWGASNCSFVVAHSLKDGCDSTLERVLRYTITLLLADLGIRGRKQWFWLGATFPIQSLNKHLWVTSAHFKVEVANGCSLVQPTTGFYFLNSILSMVG